jgi:hypothetical protein
MALDISKLWFSQCILVFSINKTHCHNITEILLKVALNTHSSTKFISFVDDIVTAVTFTSDGGTTALFKVGTYIHITNKSFM